MATKPTASRSRGWAFTYFSDIDKQSPQWKDNFVSLEDLERRRQEMITGARESYELAEAVHFSESGIPGNEDHLIALAKEIEQWWATIKFLELRPLLSFKHEHEVAGVFSHNEINYFGVLSPPTTP